MATYVNNGNINWNGSWQTVSQNSVLHASTNIPVVTGTPQYSVGWAANTSNTDLGVIMYFISAASTYPTITIALQQADDAGFTTNLTTQASTTMVLSASTYASQILFVYSASFTELTGKYYRIMVTSNQASSTNFRADNANTAKIAVTQVLSATGTPTNGDTMYITGYVTGASNNPTAATVTVNVNDSTNIYNPILCSGGTLQYATSSSTTYYLKVATFTTYPNTTLNMGTSGTPMPLTSRATLEFATSSYQQPVFYTLTMYGTGFTGNVWRSTLSSTTSATGTSVVCVDNVQTAGWAAGDIISLSTTDIVGHTEYATIGSVSGSTITINSGVTYNHLSGAEVCNLSRPVRMYSSGSYAGIVVPQTVSVTWTLEHAEFEGLRANYDFSGALTLNQTGGTLTLSIDYCSFKDCRDNATGGSSGRGIIYIRENGGLTTLRNMTDNVFIGSAYGNLVLALRTYNNYVFTNFTIANSGPNVQMMSHASGGDGANVLMVNCNIYDYTSAPSGSVFNAQTGGNSSYSMYNCKVWATRGLAISNGVFFLLLQNCILGGDGTNTISNTTYDLNWSAPCKIVAYNTSLLSTTPITGVTGTPAFFTRNDLYSTGAYINNVNKVANRFLHSFYNGQISDQVTAGYTAPYARGGSGQCVCVHPTSTSSAMYWMFYVPITVASHTVNFYITKSTSGFNGTVNVDIYDSNDNYNLVVNNDSIAVASIPVNNGTGSPWTYQYASSSFTPSQAGFCRVVVKVVQGTSAGDIFIDDTSVT